MSVTILCSRCGRPVRMTSLGCYGHVEPERVTSGRPCAARVARDVSGGACPPSAPPTVPDLDLADMTPDAIDADWEARAALYRGGNAA